MQERQGNTSVAALIRTQRATRKYRQQAVAEADIRIILDAGRRAQSANNKQPWTFMVVRDAERLHLLSEGGRSTDQIAGAAFAIAIATARTGAEDDFDLGQAAAYLQLVAWDLGIGSCIAWIHYPEKVSQALHLPVGLNCPVVLSFGYSMPQEVPQPPKEGRRKPFDEVVRWESWD
jgi:nitroreductase